MFGYIFFSSETPIYPGSSLTPLEQFLRAVWEADSQAIGLSKVPE